MKKIKKAIDKFITKDFCKHSTENDIRDKDIPVIKSMQDDCYVNNLKGNLGIGKF